MTNITSKDILLSATDNLVSQFKEKPNIELLLEAFCEELEEVQVTIFQLLYERLLDTAVGIQLDQWGEDVGELRKSRTDADYRKAIRVRIAINTSDGTEPVVSSIGKLLTDATRFTTTDKYPANVILYTDGSLISDDVLGEFSRVLGAGIGTEFEFSTGFPAFVFAGDNSGEGFDTGVLVDKKLSGDYLYELVKSFVNSKITYAVDAGNSVASRVTAISDARRVVVAAQASSNYEVITGVVGSTLTFANMTADFVTASGDNVTLFKNSGSGISFVARGDYAPVATTNTVTLSTPSTVSDTWICLRCDTTGSSSFRVNEYFYNELHSYLDAARETVGQVEDFVSEIRTVLSGLTGANRHSAQKLLGIELVERLVEISETKTGMSGLSLVFSTITGLNGAYTAPYVDLFKNGVRLPYNSFTVAGTSTITLDSPAVAGDIWKVVKNDVAHLMNSSTGFPSITVPV